MQFIVILFFFCFFAVSGDDKLEINTHKDTDDPLKKSYGGGINLIMQWNEPALKSDYVDIYLFYHGNSRSYKATSGLVREQVKKIELDLSQRSRPTLALFPRGRYVGTGRAGNKFRFNDLNTPEKMDKFISYCLKKFYDLKQKSHRESQSQRSRFILAVHSAGGLALCQDISKFPIEAFPHEIHVFDAHYNWNGGYCFAQLGKMIQQRIEYDNNIYKTLSPFVRDVVLIFYGGAYRCAYKTPTKINSIKIQKSIDNAFLTADPALKSHYHSEKTTISHYLIPSAFATKWIKD